MSTPRIKELRRVYGFDEVAIVPGELTINPELVSTDFPIDGITLRTPVLASAMDAVGSPKFAGKMSELGGMGVMNLEGVQARYDDPDEILNQIVTTPQDEVTGLLQKLYSAPIRHNLVGERVEEMKKNGAVCAVSVTPAKTKELAPVAAEAGADMIVVQSTVTTARHISNSARGLRFPELLEMLNVPMLVGNCVGYDVALELMETGIHGVLVGVGPGAACTTREVTGVGVPQVSATLDCAAARDEYYERTGRYVPIVTDGGIRTGGDLCKAFACGADAVMLGTPLAQAEEAPGKGYNWGMANPHPALPRGTRVKVGINGSLEEILYGPTSVTDGTQNLMGALQVCMGMIGAQTIQEMHEAEVVVAPSIKTEGKHYQLGLDS
ncbi:MAG: GuaB3 family IMP dehydrogenase-related protein [Chloroflexota bacterium]|nr:GuaB3 family IMP dehydrogenase-related protein [Chloroflexota bacterium]MDE2687992.1 GuaB3 family IMP dehydrogenase-related protein [Chloroflexota bacterium]